MSKNKPLVWNGPWKQLGWAWKLGRAGPQGVTRWGKQWARLTRSQMWCPPICFLGGGLIKGTMASTSTSVWEKVTLPALTLMPDSSLSPHMPLVPFKLLPQLWSSEVSRNKSMMSSLRGTSSVSLSLNPHWLLQPEVIGTFLPGTGHLGWDPLLLRGYLWSWDCPPNFYLPHLSVGPDHSVSPASYQSQWGFFFNSLVVGHPFGQIAGSSEWWWFCNIVVILMWLGKKARTVFTYVAILTRSPVSKYFWSYEL